jgi:3-deoxy-manno-octulosonate cytidylyltransferase (CMP-KDO synthetase)
VKAVGVIPARRAATRFPNKPLALIAGREMISWVIEGVKQAKILSEVIVATDDHEIFQVAQKNGAKAVMTNPDHPSGSDRVWEAVSNIDCDVVVNIQGDEPLVQGSDIDLLVGTFEDSTVHMSTLGASIKHEEIMDLNVVKLIRNLQSEAIYFSRYPIPFSRLPAGQVNVAELDHFVLKHIGMYGYRKSWLKAFCQSPVSPLEQGESLEQLRALSMGAKIKVIQTHSIFQGVDIPEDIAKVETRIKERIK